MGEAQTLWDFVSKNGFGGVLFLFILGTLRQWWVMGWQYTEVKKDRDEWKALALSHLSLADRAVSMAETSNAGGRG